MKNSEHFVNDWVLGVFAVKKVNYLEQEILKMSCEALCKAYGKLPEQEKIAFILAGEVPSLFQWQQDHVQNLRTGSDTDQLPALC